MAVSVAFSTLLVLLSGSGQDLVTLWDQSGGVNDPSGNKHELDLSEVIRDGDFRSVVVDNWDMEAFDSANVIWSVGNIDIEMNVYDNKYNFADFLAVEWHKVSVYGMNIFGDIFWETEFTVSSSPSVSMTDWLIQYNVISSSADTTDIQHAVFHNQNYRLRLMTPTGPSWFAVTYSSLSYGPLPLIFVARSASQPFTAPEFLDGYLGCWALAQLINVVYVYTDAVEMSPASCIDNCKTYNATVAMLVSGNQCHCADKNPSSEPVNNEINCYLACPGSGGEFCGGFGSSDGDAYYVPGSQLPGYVDTVKLYETTRYNVTTTIQIDISDIFGTPTTPAFITSVIINATGSQVPTYTVRYNEYECIEANGNMKNLSFDAAGPMAFQADGSVAKVDIIRVRCLEFVLSNAVSEAKVELWGPDASSEHVEVPALVIRGKHFTPITTTSSTTSTSTTTTSSTTPSTTSTTTTTPSTTTTTTTTPSTTTTSTTIPSTTTTSTTPSTTTTTTTTPSSTTTSSATSSPNTTTTSTSTTSNTTTPSTNKTTSSTSSTSSSSSTTTSSVSSSTPTSTVSSASTTTLPKATTESSCRCPCNQTVSQLNLTTAELEEKIVEIQRRLAVNVSKLSSTIRKLTSAEDSRTSAVGIGYLGVGIMVSILASIVFIDSAVLFKDIKKLIVNIKSGLCQRGGDSKP